MQKNSNVIIIGGMPYEIYGRALGPYRVRTSCERMGFSASVIDTPWVFNFDEFIELLKFVIGPDTLMIGISCTWQTENENDISNSWLNANFIKNFKTIFPHIEVVLGVSNISRIHENLFSVADWIVSGFSEDSLPELLKFTKGQDTKLRYSVKKINNREVKFINGNSDYIVQNMDHLETVFKASDYFKPYQPITIETCRGCVFSCAYCSYPFLGKKDYTYIRSIENLASEFVRNYDLFGTTRYMFADDTFNDSVEKISRVKRAVDMAKLPSFEFVSYIRPELLHIRPAMTDALIDLGIKGAFFGIESFNNKARKAVGRVTNIDYVLDSIALLKQKSVVRTHGSFIVGLPGDSLDDIEGWKEKLCTSKNNHFNSWSVGPLMLGKRNLEQQISFNGSIQSQENRSLIEKDPSKYGYNITGSEGNFAIWENDNMSYHKAIEVAQAFNSSTFKNQTIGGWALGRAWYHDINEEQLSDSNFKMMNPRAAGMISGRERATLILRDIRANH